MSVRNELNTLFEQSNTLRIRMGEDSGENTSRIREGQTRPNVYHYCIRLHFLDALRSLGSNALPLPNSGFLFLGDDDTHLRWIPE